MSIKRKADDVEEEDSPASLKVGSAMTSLERTTEQLICRHEDGRWRGTVEGDDDRRGQTRGDSDDEEATVVAAKSDNEHERAIA